MAPSIWHKIRETPWSSRVLFRYLLLQIPDWILCVLVLILIQRWIDYPWWVILILLFLWVIKDAILFPYLWRAYDSRGEDARPHIGEEGVVVKSLAPEGHVQIRGELWRARLEKGRPVLEGEKVRVQKVEGLTLIVAPKSNDSGGGKN